MSVLYYNVFAPAIIRVNTKSPSSALTGVNSSDRSEYGVAR